MILLLMLAAGQDTDVGPADSFHVYLLLGRSNMAGRGKPEQEDQTPHPRVFALDKEGRWAAAGGSPIEAWTPGAFHAQTKSHPWDDAVKRAAEGPVAPARGKTAATLPDGGGSRGAPAWSLQVRVSGRRIARCRRTKRDIAARGFR